MAAATGISIINITPGLSGTLLNLQFTKANATDTITIPDGYGGKVVWCDCCKESSLVKDPATAVTDLTVTLSTGTGVMRGMFLVV